MNPRHVNVYILAHKNIWARPVDSEAGGLRNSETNLGGF